MYDKRAAVKRMSAVSGSNAVTWAEVLKDLFNPLFPLLKQRPSITRQPLHPGKRHADRRHRDAIPQVQLQPKIFIKKVVRELIIHARAPLPEHELRLLSHLCGFPSRRQRVQSKSRKEEILLEGKKEEGANIRAPSSCQHLNASAISLPFCPRVFAVRRTHLPCDNLPIELRRTSSERLSTENIETTLAIASSLQASEFLRCSLLALRLPTSAAA